MSDDMVDIEGLRRTVAAVVRAEEADPDWQKRYRIVELYFQAVVRDLAVAQAQLAVVRAWIDDAVASCATHGGDVCGPTRSLTLLAAVMDEAAARVRKC